MEQVARTSKFTGAVWGIGFAAAFFVGTAALNVPLKTTDRELTAWYEVSGNRMSAVVSMFTFVAAAALFLVFLGALVERLRAVDAEGRLTNLISGAGQLFATTLAITGALRGAIGKAAGFNDQPVPDAGALRALNAASSAMLGVVAMLAAAVVIGAASALVLRGSAFPRWLGILGYVCTAVIVLSQAAFVGELAIPVVLIWAIAASVQLRRRRAITLPDVARSQVVSFS